MLKMLDLPIVAPAYSEMPPRLSDMGWFALTLFLPDFFSVEMEVFSMRFWSFLSHPENVFFSLRNSFFLFLLQDIFSHFGLIMNIIFGKEAVVMRMRMRRMRMRMRMMQTMRMRTMRMRMRTTGLMLFISSHFGPSHSCLFPRFYRKCSQFPWLDFSVLFTAIL